MNTEGMFVSAILTLFPLDSLTMLQRTGPWISWFRRFGKRVFWCSTKVRPSSPIPPFTPSPDRDLSFDRDGQPPSGDCRCQLATLRRLWHLEAHHLAIWPALAEGDCRGGRDGGCGECGSREPRGDVQGADAGPVRESVGQAVARPGEGDVGRVGVPQGRHARVLGALPAFCCCCFVSRLTFYVARSPWRERFKVSGAYNRCLSD